MIGKLDAIGVHRIPYRELEFKRQIGRGAFGVVFLASWRNSPVAIKRMHQQHLTPHSLREFLSEAKMMERVGNHPRVVRFLGVCATPGQPLCIATEYLPGGAVDRLLYSGRDLSFSLRMQWAMDAATGVLHLHAERIIHRDIAARNLLVDKNMRAKVSDFGMSRMRSSMYSKSSSAAADTTKSSVGPVCWMAPEAIVHQHYSEKSDAYSFGVMLWELLTRKRPYKEYTNLQVVLRAGILLRQFEGGENNSNDVADAATAAGDDSLPKNTGIASSSSSGNTNAAIIVQDLSQSAPKDTPGSLKALLSACLSIDCKARPSFKRIISRLGALGEGKDKELFFQHLQYHRPGQNVDDGGQMRLGQSRKDGGGAEGNWTTRAKAAAKIAESTIRIAMMRVATSSISS